MKIEEIKGKILKKQEIHRADASEKCETMLEQKEEHKRKVKWKKR